jgi:hypothetical protein
MRLPITADMILLYYRVTAKETPTPQQRALFVAQLTGFALFVRILVYEQKRILAHNRARRFEMPDGTLVPAQHAHGHAHARPIAVQIHIKTRKNDQKGRPLSPRTPHRQILLRVRDVGTCSIRAPQTQLPILCNTIRKLCSESSAAVPPIEKHGGLPRHRLNPHIHPFITNRWSINTSRGRPH